jgi:two-component system response regulator ArlR
MLKILYLEDDEEAARGVVRGLERDGYSVDLVTTGEGAVSAARAENYPMVILDWNVADALTGVDVCRELRRQKHPAGIILLTARSDVNDKVTAFDAGADDYLTKPFEYVELVARLRAILGRITGDPRRFPPQGESGFRIHHAERVLQVGTKEIELTRVHYKFLAALERARGAFVSAEELCDAIWGEATPAQRGVLYVHVNQLRAKLGDDLASRVENVRGKGYRLRIGSLGAEEHAPLRGIESAPNSRPLNLKNS